MALVSPGVQVTVIDQSNYAPTAIGSVAYILLATAEDKVAPGGTAYAAGTLVTNAEKVYTITSQRDLVTTFGTPIFKTTASGAPINGDEQNEYGLLAAYSLLGISNQVYVQRANVDLGKLSGTTIRPVDNPPTGTYWLDTVNSDWGVYEWNSATQEFTKKTVSVLNSADQIVSNVPNVSVGSIGTYAVNTVDTPNKIYYKTYDNTWQLIGSDAWKQKIPLVINTVTSPDIQANSSITINGTNIALTVGSNLTTIVSAINAETATTGIRANVLSTGFMALFTSNITLAPNANLYAFSTTASTLWSDIGFTVSNATSAIYSAADTQITPYYNVPVWQGTAGNAALKPSGSVWQKASKLGSGLSLSVKRYSTTTENWTAQTVNNFANIFSASYNLDPTSGGTNIVAGTVFTQYNTTYDDTLATYLWYRKNTTATVGTGSDATPTFTNITGNTFVITARNGLTSDATTNYTITITANTAAGIIDPVNAANIAYVTAGVASTGEIIFTHANGGDILIDDTDGALAQVGITTSGTNIYNDPSGDGNVIISNWAPIVTTDFYVDSGSPTVAPASDTLWYYGTPSRVDIMINNGSAWVGYRTLSSDIRGYNLTQTNDNGVIVSSVEPTEQDNGNGLVYGDLWLDTSDLENYPKLYRYQNVNAANTWVAISTTDNTSTNGITFADARWATSGNVNPATDDIPAISALAISSYVDLDAPDPALYPRGMLLWNTRASGYNVKRYKTNYFSAVAYPGETLPTEKATWLSVSGYDSSNVPNFGRKAPRSVVVSALKSAIDSSISIREDNNFFNIMACPGYPELIPNMVNLNSDKDSTAFVIGDTPLRLPATGTAITAWADNTAQASATGEEGLVTTSPYVGIYYPSGLTTDLSGTSVVVPPSHAVLRAIIKNDTIGFPWLAPAGTRRGIIDNISSIGYVDADSGQFISVGINQGLRDVLYQKQINPMTVLPGSGLLIYGQKTLSGTPSALDRINVARLVNYLRSQLNIITRPFLFEPNDPITRTAVSAVCTSLLNDLIAKRGVTDYLVVCDTSNNTPERIARNELYVDIAIQPTKDVEFIYIPIRLKNPGEIQDGNIASAQAVGTGA